MKQKTLPMLDVARIAAALLVITIHTSPLSDVAPNADFFLTRVLARLAVPYFFMLTGYFLEKGKWQRVKHTLCKTVALYAVCVILYLPLNIYTGDFSDWPSFPTGRLIKDLLVDGTWYHLWYLPAILLGVPVAMGLRRMGWKTAIAGAGVLYLIGLFGDSYYGFVETVDPLRAFYQGIFAVSSYTRNGLFFAPLFLLLGALCTRLHLRHPRVLAGCAFAALCAEAFALKLAGVQRHDSMYIFLPLCSVAVLCSLIEYNKCRSNIAAEI